ncbi:MAG: hypothetical protein JWN79_587 [Gemmatimonadetes bacterium]|jgi:hypothetical protein|nr:hypothetical protein [Gemmatimonadota bacterium]
MTRRRTNEAQTELFATPVHVEPLDPKATLGGSTRVERLWRVRIGDGGGTHLVFHDRHGTYCEEHGRACRAVRLVVNP